MPSILMRLGLVLSGVFLALLPSAIMPGFHEDFRSSKLLALVALGVPAYAALAFARDRARDPLRGYRRAWAVFVPLLALLSWAIAGGAPVHLAPFLLIAVTPLIFLEIGASLGDDALGRRRLFTLLAAGAVPVLVLGLLRRHAGWPEFIPDRPDVAIASTIGNSNELAEYAAPLAVFLLAGFLLLPRRWRWLGLLAPLPALVLVAVSDSRAGWVAAPAGIVVLAALLLRVRGRRDARVTGAASLGLVAAAALAIAFVPQLAPVRARILSIFDPAHPTNVVRLRTWEATADAWLGSPVLGVGAGRFESVFPHFRRAEEWILSRPESVVDSPHQEPLWILAEGGIAGVAFAAAVMALAIATLRRGLRHADPDARIWASACAAAFVAFGATALVRSPLHHPMGVMVPALLLGTLAALAGERTTSRGWMWAGHALVAVFLVLATRELQEDRLLGRALDARAYAQEATQAKDGAKIGGGFREAQRALQALRKPDLFGVERPWSSARAYRAVLLADEMARTRSFILEQGNENLAGLASDLVGPETVDVFLARIFERQPLHHQAQVFRANRDYEAVMQLRGVRRASEAAERLEASIAALQQAVADMPGAPQLKTLLARALLLDRRASEAHELVGREMAAYGNRPPRPLEVFLGEVGLHFGNDPKSFGVYLESGAEPDVESPELLEGESAFHRQDWDRALELLLVHLGKHPTDPRALYTLTAVGFNPRTRVEGARELANRAVARQKVLYAADEDRAGRIKECREQLGFALAKDPDLLDAWYLKARVGALAEDAGEAVQALGKLRSSGVDQSDLRGRLERDPAFGRMLRSGELEPALQER